MDGVIYHGNRLLPGVKEFVDWLYREGKRFLFLTNSAERSPKELQQKLARMGLDIDESHFYTSALATAKFISSQAPGSSAYVIGGAGLITALYDSGITMNDVNPDFVIVGEGSNYNYENILRAVHLVQKDVYKRQVFHSGKVVSHCFPCKLPYSKVSGAGVKCVWRMSKDWADAMLL